MLYFAKISYFFENILRNEKRNYSEITHKKYLSENINF